MMTDRSYKTENNVDSDVKHKHNNKRKQNYINQLKKNKLEKFFFFYLTGFEPVPPGILLSSVRL